MPIEILQGLAIPFLGAACVFLLRGELDHRIQKAFTGFAAGIMVAASVWSLLIPSMEESSALGSYAVLPAVVGFWVGTLFLLLLDHIIPHRGDQKLFWDEGNWQALCKACHDRKTGRGL